VSREAELTEIIAGLLSWMGQTTPRDYVRWLRVTQPELFANFPEGEAVKALSEIVDDAWNALADPEHRRPPRQNEETAR
jgi:hypothetical protein